MGLQEMQINHSILEMSQFLNIGPIQPSGIGRYILYIYIHIFILFKLIAYIH